MSEAPERIFARVAGSTTRLPDGSRALIGGWCARPEDRAVEYVRADLVPAPSVTVKPLEWKEESVGYYFADDFGHTWRVHLNQGQYSCYRSDEKDLGSFPSAIAAKAAAQADYEARIMAAIQIGPAPPNEDQP